MSLKGGLRSLLDELRSQHPQDCAILQYAFGLNQLEADAYFALVNQEATAEQLAIRLDRDRSTVQRALSRLDQQGLVVRDAQSLRGTGKKGYQYVYRSISIDNTRVIIKDLVDEVTEHLNNFVKYDWCIGRAS